MKHHRTQLSFEELLENVNPEETEEVKEKMTPDKSEQEQFPERFVTDFDHFLDYCVTKSVSLTKTTKTIARKHLIELNDLLTVQAENARTNSPQAYYPYIDFLFQLALGGRLIEIAAAGGKNVLKVTDRATLFMKLTFPEKYCSMLEIFWVDMDWERIQEQSSNPRRSYVATFYRLGNETPGKPITIVNPQTEIGKFLEQETWDWHHFYEYFEWFGLWTCQTDKARIENYYRKGAYFVKNIAVTEFGTAIMPVLIVERNLHAWNIAERRLAGEPEWFPGTPLTHVPYFEISNSDQERVDDNCLEDYSGQPFHFPFAPFFPEGSLVNTLPREMKRRKEAAYTFKVLYAKGVWRKLKLPGICMMDDLHRNIIQAYHFDDDHLYSFFMDGRKWSHNCIASPEDTFGHPDASKVRIESCGFVTGQQFNYLFDYGDEWTFLVTVEEIDEQDTSNFTPILIEEKGDGPEQYFYGEWDEDDDDE